MGAWRPPARSRSCCAPTRALLAEANGLDLTELTDGEIVEATKLSAEVAKLAEAAHVRAVGRLDVSRAWADDGARSGTAWVAWHCHLAKGRAAVVLKCARQRRAMPGTDAAMAAGRPTIDHVRLLAGCHRADAEAFADDEDRLIDAAQRLLFSAFETVIRYWIHAHAPDDAEADAAAIHDQRRVDASRSIDGIIFVDAMLDPITGEIFLRELERLEQLEFEADWADARQRLGDAATAADLRRTPKQRRADALAVMATRSAAKPADATEPRVLLHVLAGDRSVERMCELSNGTVITPGQALPLLRWADAARIISSTVPPACSTSASASACSPVPPAPPWRCATCSASTRAATCPPSAARSTTSSPTKPAGSRSRATAAATARSTTAGTTDNKRRPPDPAAGITLDPSNEHASQPLRQDALMPIERVDHVQLAMPADREADAREFYAGLLGITEVPKPPHLAARGGCWFEDDKVKIHLGVEADFRPAKKAHPALLVSDLHSLVAGLEAAGVELVTDEPLEGYDRVYAYDPFGNRLELLEPRRTK